MQSKRLENCHIGYGERRSYLGGIVHFVYGDSARVSDNLALVPEAR